MQDTASEYAKSKGLESLTEAATMLDLTPQTLRNWHKYNFDRFRIAIAGCVIEHRMIRGEDYAGMEQQIKMNGNEAHEAQEYILREGVG